MTSSAFQTLLRLALFLPGAGLASLFAAERADIRFNDDWRFAKGDPAGAARPEFADDAWEKVRLPHDRAIDEPFAEANAARNGFLPAGKGWYRKTFATHPEWNDKTVVLEFEGVFRDSVVFLNGKRVGANRFGYTEAVYDITDALRTDGKPNVLAVSIDARSIPQIRREGAREGWWYEGAGIYRNVFLHITDRLHFAHNGVATETPEVSADKALLRVASLVQNDADAEARCTVRHTLLDAEGRVVATADSREITAGQRAVSPKDSDNLARYMGDSETAKKVRADFGRIPATPESLRDLEKCELRVTSPKLWSPESPYLYTLRSEILRDGKVADRVETRVGFRWFSFDADKGFFLNGKRVEIRGMCLHHDFGGLGVALPDRAHEKNVEVCKAMGANLIRCSHNDPSPALLRACDELGMLVWGETRYMRDYLEDGLPPLKTLIERDRNHPSVILWGLANTAGPGPYLTDYLRAFHHTVKRLDPGRPTIVALEGDADANKTGFADVTDVCGYNGGGLFGKHAKDHVAYPKRKIVVSEFSSGRCARGVYENTDTSKAKAPVVTLEDGHSFALEGRYSSCYTGCDAFEAEWSKQVAPYAWCAGGVMWSGIDYWGESLAWPSVTSQFGALDIARFPKDPYYYFLQEWTDKPMVHIMPHWTWPGRTKPVNIRVYSNCERVELFLNGESLGVREATPHRHREWKEVKYAPGKLVAKAMNGGKVVAEQTLETAGSPAVITASADREKLRADGEDLAFVTLDIRDAKGREVPVADNPVTVRVTGPGRLIGLSSGDPCSHEPAHGETMKAFSGKLLAIVQTTGAPGDIGVAATAPGLTGARIRITTTK